MINQKRFWRELFSVRGRRGRKAFWMTALLLIPASLIGGEIVISLSSFDLPWASVAFGVMLFLAIFAVSLCNSIQRIHDIGHSAWWLAPLFLVGLLLSMAGVGAASAGESEGAANIGGGFNLLCLIVMGALPGTDGPNKFGDPPGGAPEPLPA